MMKLKEANARQVMTSPGRTRGDGMENDIASVIESARTIKREKNSLGDQFIYRPSDFKKCSSNPPTITGKIVNLIPKHVTQTKKDLSVLKNLKVKEPKFVPYEPYKAAVKPIIPYEKKVKSGERTLSRKSTDFKVVAPNVASILESVHNVKISDGKDCDNNEALKEFELERKAMEEEIKTLREENGQLESQLKFQAQVNGELKTLLVAAVGEDIEIRVHLLTEDKLQLARALLNSAQTLSTHQEQTEWLAGQCEVWRSKFLASSLMVEELAKWKAALCQKATELQETLKRILEERSKVRDSLLNTYRTLSILRAHYDHGHAGSYSSRKADLASTNVLDLAAGTQRLSEWLQPHLMSGNDVRLSHEPDFTGLEMNTRAEKAAEALLLNPNSLLLSGRPDIACNAVMGALGAAVAVGGLGPSPLSVSCCAHCSGDIKLV